MGRRVFFWCITLLSRATFCSMSTTLLFAYVRSLVLPAFITYVLTYTLILADIHA